MTSCCIHYFQERVSNLAKSHNVLTRFARRKTTSFRPLSALLTESAAPELLFMETKWASLVSYGLTVDALTTDRMEALRRYTVGSAWFSGEEDKKGAIVPPAARDAAAAYERELANAVKGLRKPTLAAWAPNILFAAAAGCMLLTVRT